MQLTQKDRDAWADAATSAERQAWLRDIKARLRQERSEKRYEEKILRGLRAMFPPR